MFSPPRLIFRVSWSNILHQLASMQHVSGAPRRQHLCVIHQYWAVPLIIDKKFLVLSVKFIVALDESCVAICWHKIPAI